MFLMDKKRCIERLKGHLPCRVEVDYFVSIFVVFAVFSLGSSSRASYYVILPCIKKLHFTYFIHRSTLSLIPVRSASAALRRGGGMQHPGPQFRGPAIDAGYRSVSGPHLAHHLGQHLP